MIEENGTENDNSTVQTINGDVHRSSPLKMIVEISSNSKIEQQIHHVLQKHFLEHRSIDWKPFNVELIVNTSLTDDFFAIRKRFEKASAGNRCEFEEHFAFLIENEQQIIDIAQDGYQTMETSFNVLGHSKSGVYVCKYADVCLRHAAARRTAEENTSIKMLIFKIVTGKQTAALVRKGPKLQPIGPTPNFTSHCSVITPKETEDLDKQFDQSQIFLYEFEGRETVKRPHHCLPYAIVNFIQDGSQWPTNFDDHLDIESDILDTDTLKVIAQTDDPLIQNKLKENVELAEAATRALERIYEEEPSTSTTSQTILSPSNHPEAHSSTINGIGSGASPSASNEHLSSSSPTPNHSSTLISSSDVVHPPAATAPLPSSSASSTSSTSSTPIPSAKTPATAVATTIPLAHTAAAVQAAYRQQNSLLGALPNFAALRTASNAVYATPAGLANSLTGPIIYGGIPMDALRGFPGTAATTGSPFVFATHAGQTIQQPALYAAQLQAVAQQQQQAAAQFAALQQQQQQFQQQQQQQQHQQQGFVNGIPAGCMLVRTATGGYALLAQAPNASAQGVLQAQAQPSLAQQQFIAVNANGQATVANSRVPVAAMLAAGGGQSMMYPYAGQPTIQAGPTQYIQLPNNTGHVQQQQQPPHPSTSPVLPTAVYSSQTGTQYISAGQLTNNNGTGSTSTNGSNTVVPSSTTNVSQIQPTSTIISPQKQSAATATAAAMQQQQQYQHVLSTQQQQQQQQQQQPNVNGAHGSGVYYAAINQAQAQLNAQVQAQQQAALAFAQQQQQQQQQQMNLFSQFPYAAQAGVPQAMYYTSTGGQTIYQTAGQSYVLAQAAPTVGGTTTTGAPAIYSAGPALHNATNGQQNPTAYQMITTTTNGNVPAGAGPGVVAQQPPQLVQRSTVLPQVRHHPYRS